jgi:HNH endonuclease
VIPPEAMTIIATIGLTQDQAVQVARALSMVEAATFEASIERAKAQSALGGSYERRHGIGVEEWEALRAAVFERDGFVCQYCRADVRESPQCDHIIPLVRGGQSELSNLTTSCKRCNSSKSGLLISEWKGPPKSGAERQARYRALHSVTPSSPVTKSDGSNIGVTERNAGVTPSRARVLCGAEEVDINPRMTTSSTPKGVGRGSRLPEDWSPSEAHKSEAVRLGLSAEDLAQIAEEFRNFWLSEAGQRVPQSPARSNPPLSQKKRGEFQWIPVKRSQAPGGIREARREAATLR